MAASSLTPKQYLEKCTISGAEPNDSFTYAMYTETSYSFEAHSHVVKLKLIDLKSKEVSTLLESQTPQSLASPVWVHGDIIAWLCSKESGNTDLVLADITNVKGRWVAGTIPGPAWDLKIAFGEEAHVIAFAAKANKDGSLHNPKDKPKPYTSVKLYSSNLTRRRDAGITPERNAIFYATLGKGRDWTLGSIQNALRAKPELESPTPSLTGSTQFAVFELGIVFVSKNPDLDPSMHTQSDVYYANILDFNEPPNSVKRMTVKGHDGAATCPVVSPYCHNLAFLKKRDDGNDSGTNEIVWIPGFVEGLTTAYVLKRLSDHCELDPKKIYWYKESILEGNIFILADEQAQTNILQKNILQGLNSGYVECAKMLKEAKDIAERATLITSPLRIMHGEFNSKFSFKRDPGYEVHSFVMRPPDFDPTKAYPVCFLLHAGPYSCFRDTWSSHSLLIPHIFAGAGYVVIMPHWTRTRGYGQTHKDRVEEDWHRRPLEDIKECFAYVGAHFPHVDLKRAILGGTNLGGFMTNLIAGTEFATNFRVFFTLNGIFSMQQLLATGDLRFVRQNFGGLPWNGNQKMVKRWRRHDPAANAHKWNKPMIIVHNENDHTFGIEHGLAAFNCLQTKGIKSAFLKFEDETHSMSHPENLRAMYAGILEFVNAEVGLEMPKGEQTLTPVR